VAKVEAAHYGDRKVYSVSAFNRGVAEWLSRLPTVWVEGEVTELKRQRAWASVFFTLKDPTDGASLPVSMARGQFDALQLDLVEGERVHVYGRPELFAGTLTEKLLTFALGRGVEYYDAPAVRQILREARPDGYRFSSLILGIVKSVPFQMRRSS